MEQSALGCTSQKEAQTPKQASTWACLAKDSSTVVPLQFAPIPSPAYTAVPTRAKGLTHRGGLTTLGTPPGAQQHSVRHFPQYNRQTSAMHDIGSNNNAPAGVRAATPGLFTLSQLTPTSHSSGHRVSRLSSPLGRYAAVVCLLSAMCALSQRAFETSPTQTKTLPKAGVTTGQRSEAHV